MTTFPSLSILLSLGIKTEISPIKTRAKRRYKQLYSTNKSIEFKNILLDLENRDISDKSRKNSPLILSEDSILINTEFLNPNQVLKKALFYMKK